MPPLPASGVARGSTSASSAAGKNVRVVGRQDGAAAKGWGRGGARPGSGSNSNLRGSGAASLGHIAQLKDMGFTEEVAKKALAESVWDVNRALDLLISRGAAAFETKATGEGGEAGSLKLVPESNDRVLPADSAWRSRPASGTKTKVGAAGGSAQPAGSVVPGASAGSGIAGGNDWAECSTTASTSSSPRSFGRVEKGGSLSKSASSRRDVDVGISATSVAASPVATVARSIPNSATAPSFAPLVSSPSPTSGASEHVANAVGETAPAPCAEASETAIPSTPPCSSAFVPVAPVDISAGATELEAIIEQDFAASADSQDLDLPPPPKHIERVDSDWIAEVSEGQLAVDNGEFVRVWSDTKTEIGWIYAETLQPGRAGWLPMFAFDATLSERQRWMEVIRSDSSENEGQLDVVAGMVLKVDAASRTQEGWTYAQTHDESQAGWVSAFCLDWDAAVRSP
eukprot:TRINITY_DN1191_c0_g1_i1.p1 TRINITY_DN1191_c0_g1~~TRINITY_DN1191_c0_g1_i1.p1  ORF type:complete len:457 (-),score=77.85 TRINITY_DN1191_c0_g1_i1:121-1491(-)